jgi:hypothetical protein
MNTLHKTKSNNPESGVALIIALLVLLIITAVGFGMISMSTTETNISSNYRDQQTAFFAARAGLEEVRDRLRSGAPNSLNGIVPTNLPGQNNGVLYTTNPANGEVVAPWNTAANNYPDTEICREAACTNGVPAGNPWYTNPAAAVASATYAANPTLNWKWARLTVKTNKTAATAGAYSVDGTTSAGPQRVCWNGSNQVLAGVAATDCGANGAVYSLTVLAVTPSGSRRMLQYELTLNVNIPVVAALYTRLASDTGQALNVTGFTDPVCSASPTYGAASGSSTVTTPGSGNVTGSPSGTINNYGWTLGDMSRLINPLLPTATDITTVSGITNAGGTPPSYTLPQGSLGTPPTVTRDSSQAITSITAPGTPITYKTPPVDTLTLGGSGPITGQGVLIVQGNLTIDVGRGFDYYGLIVATGNITFMSSTNSSVTPHIHGAILGGGSFSAPISNFGGSISVHQNSCMVQQALSGVFYRTVANREMMN